MPRKQKLKVFRTPTGFHDAYVAAPSQKAALTAWGSEHDLFARGIAEKVDDPELMREPLSRPGVVIRRLRGDLSEQIAALPKDKPARRRSPAPKRVDVPAQDRPARTTKQAVPSRPKPDRAALDAAERALAEAEKRQKKERSALARRLTELEREQRELVIARIPGLAPSKYPLIYRDEKRCNALRSRKDAPSKVTCFNENHDCEYDLVRLAALQHSDRVTSGRIARIGSGAVCGAISALAGRKSPTRRCAAAFRLDQRYSRDDGLSDRSSDAMARRPKRYCQSKGGRLLGLVLQQDTPEAPSMLQPRRGFIGSATL